MKRAVFLDRDGVINAMVYDSDHGLVDSPVNADQFTLLPGVAEAIRRINNLGLLVIVVSNQPVIAKGKASRSLVQGVICRMHLCLAAEGARVDAAYYCLHHPEATADEFRVDCDCRKPRPGLLLQAQAEMDLDLSGCYMVGDGITDVQAGQAAKTRTLLISKRKCYLCDQLANHHAQPDYVVADLSEAVDVIAHIEAGEVASLAAHSLSCPCDVASSNDESAERLPEGG